MLNSMTQTQSQKAVVQSDEKIKDQAKVLSEASAVPNPNKAKKALSKREIMEQLSRERFPWDE
jgi:uncharacterized membrane protein required for colicin V production